MGKKYINPPIIEALCEFQFDPGPEWDMTIPGLFYEKVRDDFPKKKTVANLSVKYDQKMQQVQQEVKQRMQFWQEDEKALVQVAPNLLTVNCLKPYPTWTNFKPLILDNLNKYIEIANPKGVRRIGLRYINRVKLKKEVEKGKIELEEYFNFYPKLEQGLPQDHGPFIVGVQLSFENSRDILKLQLTSDEGKEQEAFYSLLDLDYFLTKPEEVPLDQIESWIETAHTHVEDIFEATITNELRILFEKEE